MADKRPPLKYEFRNIGGVREKRLNKKAKLIGQVKSLTREIMNREVLINAMNKELVRSMYERFATSVEMAAVLRVVQKKDDSLYQSLVAGYTTHADDLGTAPLNISDSDIVIAKG